MAKLDQCYSHFSSNKSNLNSFSNLLSFVIGISLGLTIGFFDLQNSPLYISSSLPLPSTSSYISLSSEAPPPPPPPPPPPSPQLKEPLANGTFNSKNNNSKYNMSDEELLWKASMIPQVEKYPFEYVPKVAFMFLTKGELPLAPLWESFFKGHEGFYSIYVHAHPHFNDSSPPNSVFYGRYVPSQIVKWGNITMIDAEKRLLANALLDFSNQRFVLLSESCIPLYNFTTIYNHLINSKLSFLSSIDDPRIYGRGHYNSKMSPTISIEEWRKGSQWFEIDRNVAVQLISDRKYYPLFKEYCTKPCYSDEHYFPTLANIIVPNLIANRSVTWVDWSRPEPHPGRFIKADITEEFLNRIKYGSNCSYNGNATSLCFLFARKFVWNTLEPLLRIAPNILGFGN